LYGDQNKEKNDTLTKYEDLLLEKEELLREITRKVNIIKDQLVDLVHQFEVDFYFRRKKCLIICY